jgi:hypothetical protein
VPDPSVIDGVAVCGSALVYSLQTVELALEPEAVALAQIVSVEAGSR